jgi:hypothetical protein
MLGLFDRRRIVKLLTDSRQYLAGLQSDSPGELGLDYPSVNI